jgi:hypothetical protein
MAVFVFGIPDAVLGFFFQNIVQVYLVVSDYCGFLAEKLVIIPKLVFVKNHF